MCPLLLRVPPCGNIIIGIPYFSRVSFWRLLNCPEAKVLIVQTVCLRSTSVLPLAFDTSGELIKQASGEMYGSFLGNTE